MTIINWSSVFAIALVFFGLIGCLAVGAQYAWKWWKTPKSDTASVAVRSADEGPPAGAVAWLDDLCVRMGKASAESKLECARAGMTGDQARAKRIAELEASK